ncbi:hypothetical protein OQA88_7842 [Cercophora sp. LCS_1]
MADNNPSSERQAGARLPSTTKDRNPDTSSSSNYTTLLKHTPTPSLVSTAPTSPDYIPVVSKSNNSSEDTTIIASQGSSMSSLSAHQAPRRDSAAVPVTSSGPVTAPRAQRDRPAAKPVSKYNPATAEYIPGLLASMPNIRMTEPQPLHAAAQSFPTSNNAIRNGALTTGVSACNAAILSATLHDGGERLDDARSFWGPRSNAGPSNLLPDFRELNLFPQPPQRRNFSDGSSNTPVPIPLAPPSVVGQGVRPLSNYPAAILTPVRAPIQPPALPSPFYGFANSPYEHSPPRPVPEPENAGGLVQYGPTAPELEYPAEPIMHRPPPVAVGDMDQRTFRPMEIRNMHRPDPYDLMIKGYSPNYLGNPNIDRNRSADISPEKNCSVFITGLSPDLTTTDLLGSIRNIGRIYATHINQPDPCKGHHTCAAKVVFFERVAAERFYNQYHMEGFAVIRRPDYVGRVVWNRIRSAEQDPGGRKSRVLIISGPKHIVNAESLDSYFRSKITFQIDTIRTYYKPDDAMESLGRERELVEFRFGSYRCQAEAARMALAREYKEYGIYCDFGPDPCDLEESLQGYPYKP